MFNFYFRLHAGSVKGPQVVDFLRALVRHIPQPLLLVWDRLPAHRSHAVRDYLGSRVPAAPRARTESSGIHLGVLETA